MIEIGTFETMDDGFRGHVRTPCLNIEVVLHSIGSGDGPATQYDVRLGPGDFGTRIGRGVRRINGMLGECIFVLIDDPSFAEPIRATLYPSLLGGGRHDLFWDEPRDRWKVD